MQNRIILLILISFLFSTCKKDAADQSASLKITVTHNGSVVPGASVKIFANTPMVQIGATQTTGADGTTTFTGLIPTTYFFDAEKGCMNNLLDLNIGNFPLLPNSLNERTAEIDSVGYLKIRNNTSVSYAVSGFGSGILLQAGGVFTTPRFTGPYTITGGPDGNPGAARDTLVNVNCIDTVRITYPL